MKEIIKKLVLIFLISSFIFSCHFGKEVDFVGHLQVSESIKDTFANQSSNFKYMNVDIDKKGYIGKNHASNICLLNNGYLEYLPNNPDDHWIEKSNIFPFAYKTSDTSSTYIHIYTGFNTITNNLILQFKKDSIFKADYWSIIYLGNSCYVSKMLDGKLILDKNHYEVGDTMIGYVYYKGLEQSKKVHYTTWKVYFKCVVGSSSNPLDYVDTYQKCEAINKDDKLKN